MSANDFDWAQEVNDAIEEYELKEQVDDCIEAHLALRFWLLGRLTQSIQA
jgi:hypothetical protein